MDNLVSSITCFKHGSYEGSTNYSQRNWNGSFQESLLYREANWVPRLFSVLRHLKPKCLALAHLSLGAVAAAFPLYNHVTLQLRIILWAPLASLEKKNKFILKAHIVQVTISLFVHYAQYYHRLLVMRPTGPIQRSPPLAGHFPPTDNRRGMFWFHPHSNPIM